MTEIKCKICGETGELEEKDVPGAPAIRGIVALSMATNKEYHSIVGIWNYREEKANWICLACLSEKLGIEENRKVRGGMF